jgi:hypothetical protein
MSMAADLSTPLSLGVTWPRRFGSAGTDRGLSAAVAPNGDVAVAGFFNSSFDLDGTPVSSSLPQGLLVAMLDRSTSKQTWVRSITTNPPAPDGRHLASVAVDRAGDVIVAGAFSGSFDCGDGKALVSRSDDAFVAKYRGSDGICVWSRMFGGGTEEFVYAVTTNSSKDILIAGAYNSNPLDFHGTNYASVGDFDLFVARYDANGGNQVLTRYGSNGKDLAYSIATDASDNVYVTGVFSKGLSFSTDALVNQGMLDVFLVKFKRDLSGVVWAKSYGGAANDYSLSVAASPAGDLAIAGSFQGTVDFSPLKPNPILLGSKGDTDGFLVGVDSTGSTRWAHRFGGTQTDGAYAVAADGLGNVLLAGTYNGMARLDDIDKTATGQDVYMARYSLVDGRRLWLEILSGGKTEVVFGAGANMNGDGAVTGYTDSDPLPVGGKSLNGSGGHDIYVIKLSPMFASDVSRASC